MGYDSCDSGFMCYRTSNLATWLGLRPSWAGCTMIPLGGGLQMEHRMVHSGVGGWSPTVDSGGSLKLLARYLRAGARQL